MSMLSGDVEKLSYVRKHDYVPKSIDAIERQSTIS